MGSGLLCAQLMAKHLACDLSSLLGSTVVIRLETFCKRWLPVGNFNSALEAIVKGSLSTAASQHLGLYHTFSCKSLKEC